MSSRMRRPEAVKLEISRGDWLLVKKRLTAGEHRAMVSGYVNADGNGINAVQVGLSKMIAYLLDWSITDADDKPVVIKEQSATVVQAALDALDVESYKEILRAIEAHEDAMEKELEQTKNVQGGGTESSAISPSAA